MNAQKYLCLLFWVVFYVTASPICAQETGSIQGRVQRQGESIAEHRVMLIRFGPDNQVERVPGQTNAQGEFFFENLDTSGTFTYFVGIRYNDQLHRSEPIKLNDTPKRTGVVVSITEQPEAPALEANAPYIVNHLMVVAWRETQLEVRNVVQLFHPAATPYTGQPPRPGAPPISLRVSLPQGYKNLREIQGLDKERLVQHARGMYYTAPLAPGEHRVIYTYSLPWSSKVTTLLLERVLATQALDLLVAEEYLVASSDLEFLGPVPLAEQTFAHFRGTNLEGAGRSWLQLTKRQDQYSAVVKLSAYAVIIGIALLGIVVSLLPQKTASS